MTLLDNHLEQISLSSTAIAELPFPAPKIFTNSLLRSHDITALIRDTEAHERALFTLEALDQGSRSTTANPVRRNTVYGPNGTTEPHVHGAGLMRNPRQGSAVSTLLGGELGEQIRKENLREGKERGEIDVDLLLRGAQKLCGVYPVPGASEKIASLRSRYEQLNSIARYESKVVRQITQLEKMNRHTEGNGQFEEEGEEDFDADAIDERVAQYHVTEEDLRREDEEIRELEKKKRGLEDRVSGMERDLGGLLR